MGILSYQMGQLLPVEKYLIRAIYTKKYTEHNKTLSILSDLS